MFDLCNIYVIYICGNVKNISRITSLSFTTVINFVESNWGNLTSCTVKHFKIFIKVIFLCKLPHTETFFFIYFTWISQKFILTVQKMKFSRYYCGFSHISWKNPWWKTSLFFQWKNGSLYWATTEEWIFEKSNWNK